MKTAYEGQWRPQVALADLEMLATQWVQGNALDVVRGSGTLLTANRQGASYGLHAEELEGQ